MILVQIQYISICLTIKYHLSIFSYVSMRVPGGEEEMKEEMLGEDSLGVTDFILPKKVFSWPWVQILDTLL